MMAKDSVKKRLAEREKECLYWVYVPINSRIRFLSFIQGIQLPVANGGFRPMGNITTGTELVRRMNEEAKAMQWLVRWLQKQTVLNLVNSKAEMCG
jgi:hypothetical protein